MVIFELLGRLGLPPISEPYAKFIFNKRNQIKTKIYQNFMLKKEIHTSLLRTK